MSWWIRAYLVFAAVQGFGIGLTGLQSPADIEIPLRITPLNARFVAALYVAGGVGVLWGAFSQRRTQARLFVVAFAFATALILAVTLLHWSEFLAVGLPHQPVWMFDYIVDPLLGLAVIHFARLWPPWPTRKHVLTPLLVVQAVAFGLVGLALLVVPDTMAALWPWALPPVLGQVYGCFFLTFALGAGVAAGEVEPHAVRGFLLSTLTLMALVLLASWLHVDRFKAEPVTVIWFAAFGLGLVLFAGAFAADWWLARVPSAQVAAR
ncbi:MAG TPA: hypothetical protein VGJ60_06490 [Chloroflexota bacterium]